MPTRKPRRFACASYATGAQFASSPARLAAWRETPGAWSQCTRPPHSAARSASGNRDTGRTNGVGIELPCLYNSSISYKQLVRGCTSTLNNTRRGAPANGLATQCACCAPSEPTRPCCAASHPHPPRRPVRRRCTPRVDTSCTSTCSCLPEQREPEFFVLRWHHSQGSGNDMATLVPNRRSSFFHAPRSEVWGVGIS